MSAGSIPSSRLQRAAPWLVVAVTVVLAVRLWRFVDLHAVNLMVMDQFDFFAPLFDGGYSALEKFRFQFWKSPHRMGLGWPVIEAVARASSWDTRADAFSIAVVALLACAMALLLVRRIFGRLSLWDLCVPLLLLSLKQFGTFVGTPDVALGALPVLLLVCCGLALTLRIPGVRIATLLLLNLLCVYTGFALFAGLWIPLLLAYEGWSRSLRPAVAVAAVVASALLGLSFFVGFDGTPATRPVAADLGVLSYLSYATNLFVSFFHAKGAVAAAVIGLVWPLLLLLPLAVAGGRLLQRRAQPIDRVIFLLAGFGATFVTANTLGRIGVSPDYAFASRYVTLMVPGVFAFYLALRSIRASRVRSAVLAAFLLVLVVGELSGGVDAGHAAEAGARAKRAWRDCYVVSRSFDACNERIGAVVYPKVDEFERIRGRLRQLEERSLNLFKGAPAPRVESRAAPRNLLLISVDTLRADHLGTYGHARPTSPRIDALAAEGLVFEQAMSTAPWTLPAHASLLTGLYPSAHRLQDDGVRLGDDVSTLAEGLAAVGMTGIAVVSHVYVASPFGFDRGFERFDDTLIEGGATNPRADAVVDRLLEHLDGHRAAAGSSAPFFAFAHFYDPHWDYAAPPPYGRRFVAPDYAGPIDGSYESMKSFLHVPDEMTDDDRSALVGFYEGEIAYLDSQIGRLLDGLEARGLRGDTLVVLSADHGEEFKEHKRLGHGRTLFDEQLHVPLIFSSHPALGSGRRSELVSLVDVAPTLLDLFGAAPLAASPGRSLVEAPTPEEAGARLVMAESIRFGIDLSAVRGPEHKLIDVRSNGWELYFDLQADGAEQHPAAEDPTGGRLRAALDAHRSSADVGWQLQLVGRGAPLRLRARVRSSAKIVDARHYFSGRVDGSEARFADFSVSEDGRRLEIDVVVERHVGQIRFATEPPDARIEIEIDALEGGRLFVAGQPKEHSRVLGFEPGGAALAKPLPLFSALDPGIYLRRAQQEPASPAVLSDAAKARLEALGYGERAMEGELGQPGGAASEALEIKTDDALEVR